MKNRALSLLLMLAMLLSLLPVSALAVDRNETKDQVHVIVENTTFPKSEGAPWEGTLVDTWVDLSEDSTMMSCVGAALNEKGYTAKGMENNYINEINDLAEFDGGPMSGWMGTLNDWFTNQGFGAYTVKDGTLGTGDEIRIMYTKDYGADLGGSWGNTDTSLKALSFSAGTLTPEFASKTLEYTLDVPAGTEGVVVTPTAANKNFQVHVKVGETEYKRTATVPVADETVITIEVGTGESMNQGATPTIYKVAVHTAQSEDLIKEVEALIAAIGDVTLESQEKIEAARAAYDKLTDEQKSQVSNYQVLEAAEESLRIWQMPKVDTAKAFQDTGDYLEKLAKKTPPIVNSIGGEWLVLGLVRSGREEPAGYYDNVLSYVTQKINEKEQLHRNKSSDNSRVILALTAIGKDVTDVAGHNLLKGLTDMKYVEKQGINGPIWALIAFDSKNYEIPTAFEGGKQVTREGLLESILAAQLEDGGWALSGTTADPDMTAMAVQSLAPYYEKNERVKAAVDRAVETLSQMQMADGGFGSWGTVNSESAAQVIVALTSLGIDPNTDTRFVKNGRSVVNALCDYFVEGGGFKHVADKEVDGMASEQAYYALTACDRLQKGQTSLYDMSDVTTQTEKPLPFTDVPEEKWYHDAVKFVYNNGLMDGVSETRFAPQNKLTRGQLVTILYRMEKEPEVSTETPFVDLRAGSYYEAAVVWAHSVGIANGVDNTHFAPNHPVTREQMVTFFARYAKLKGADMSKTADLTSYQDGDKVSNFAAESMAWAVGNEIVNGVSATMLKPQGTAVRAQAAQIIQRLWNFLG